MGLTGTQNTSYIDIGNADIYLAGIPVGSVKNGAFEGSYEKQEHKSGYPQVVDKSVITGLSAQFKGTWEEVNGENLRVALGVDESATGFQRKQVSVTRDLATNSRFQVRLIGVGSTFKSYVGALCNDNLEGQNDGSVNGTSFTSATAQFQTNGVKAGHFVWIKTGTHAGKVVKVSSVTDENTLVLSESLATDSGFSYQVMEMGVYDGNDGSAQLLTPDTDYSYDSSFGTIYALSGGSIESAINANGSTTVYVEYVHAKSSFTRIPLGATTKILEIPVLIEKVRNSDGRLFQIMFWKASPGQSFSLPFTADDWQSYEVTLVSVKDPLHPEAPLGYIDIPDA